MMKRLLGVGLLVFFVSAPFYAAHAAQKITSTPPVPAEIDTSIWRFLAATNSATWTVTREDSEKAYRTHFFNGTKAFREYASLYQKIETKRATTAELADDMIKHLVQAQQEFEKGIKLDPRNSYLRTAIAAVYSGLEQLYAFQNDNSRRLPILFNKIYLESNLLKRADLYNKIARIYFNLRDWTRARDNFQLAVSTMFEGAESEIDTVKLFDNIYYRGYSQLKLYEDVPALTSFEYASIIAPSEAQKKDIARWIEYINWDSGNIRATEKYQRALALAVEKKYDEAEKAYSELIPMLQSTTAKNEVEYRLSIIQFNSLSKKHEAIQRLWNVLKAFPLDTTANARTKNSHTDYWESYCKMCLNLAMTSLHDDKKTAFMYFEKVSQIENSERGKALLNLAILSLNNPDLCLNFCERTLSYLDRLAESDKKMLYNIYYQAHQRKGDFDEALKWFKKYHEI